MSTAERQLLLLVARWMIQILIWGTDRRNNGRDAAQRIAELCAKVEKDAG